LGAAVWWQPISSWRGPGRPGDGRLAVGALLPGRLAPTVPPAGRQAMQRRAHAQVGRPPPPAHRRAAGPDRPGGFLPRRLRPAERDAPPPRSRLLALRPRLDAALVEAAARRGAAAFDGTPRGPSGPIRRWWSWPTGAPWPPRMPALARSTAPLDTRRVQPLPRGKSLFRAGSIVQSAL